MSAKLIASYDDEQYYALNTLVVVTPKHECRLKYILGLLNSNLFNYIYSKKFKSTKTVFSEIQAKSVGELPIKKDSLIANEIERLVSTVLSKKRTDPQSNTCLEETSIDFLVYHLYGLTYDEVLIVDPETPITRNEYEKIEN